MAAALVIMKKPPICEQIVGLNLLWTPALSWTHSYGTQNNHETLSASISCETECWISKISYWEAQSHFSLNVTPNGELGMFWACSRHCGLTWLKAGRGWLEGGRKVVGRWSGGGREVVGRCSGGGRRWSGGGRRWSEVVGAWSEAGRLEVAAWF